LRYGVMGRDTEGGGGGPKEGQDGPAAEFAGMELPLLFLRGDDGSRVARCDSASGRRMLRRDVVGRAREGGGDGPERRDGPAAAFDGLLPPLPFRLDDEASKVDRCDPVSGVRYEAVQPSSARSSSLEDRAVAAAVAPPRIWIRGFEFRDSPALSRFAAQGSRKSNTGKRTARCTLLAWTCRRPVRRGGMERSRREHTRRGPVS
jgi:hypothetical protein